MAGAGSSQAQSELLLERLSLATAASRMGLRGIAVLSIEVHERGARPGAAAAALEALSEDVVARIRQCIERVDTISVVGRMRYLVLLERIQEGSFAIHAADRIVRAMRQPIRMNGRVVELVASIGVSTFPDDGERTEELVERAERAREGARMGGGDLVGFCSGATSADAQRRLQIERALAGAVERGELELHYQPQIDTQHDAIVGVEALLRWRHATLGRVSPAEFIPVLEATGQIVAVGEWTLRAACRQAAEWERAGQKVRVGVNVSARQLETASFEKLVVDTLEETKIDPRSLELELTESVLVKNPASTRSVLESFRRLGIRIALDDFGTGFASLAYIRHFPLDTLKIDREFVRGLPADPEGAAITSSIIALGHNLRLEMVAEGVETEAEEEFLHSQRCYVVQGFRHARPMPVPDLAEWRLARPWL